VHPASISKDKLGTPEVISCALAHLADYSQLFHLGNQNFSLLGMSLQYRAPRTRQRLVCEG
jgi:hypothetical protein